MKKYLRYLWRALENTIIHDGVEHAGYMSFMVLLSFFPFIVFFLDFTSFLGASDLGSHFVNFIIDSLPQHATESIRSRVYELIKAPPDSLMNLAIIGTIWTSSSFVEGMRTILNRVYNIKTPPPYLFRRLLSILQFIIINIIISLTMVLFVVIPTGINKIPELEHLLKNASPLLGYLRYVFVWGSLFLTICTFYCVLPNRKVKFMEVIPGALVTLLLWMISGNLLVAYIDYYTQFSLVYGSLGSIIITMLFFYINSIIFIYGAELNYQIHHSDSE